MYILKKKIIFLKDQGIHKGELKGLSEVFFLKKIELNFLATVNILEL